MARVSASRSVLTRTQVRHATQIGPNSAAANASALRSARRWPARSGARSRRPAGRHGVPVRPLWACTADHAPHKYTRVHSDCGKSRGSTYAQESPYEGASFSSAPSQSPLCWRVRQAAAALERRWYMARGFLFGVTGSTGPRAVLHVHQLGPTAVVTGYRRLLRGRTGSRCSDGADSGSVTTVDAVPVGPGAQVRTTRILHLAFG